MRYVFVWLDLLPCALCDGIFCYGPLRTEVQGYWWCIIIIAVLNTGHYIAYSKHPTTIVRGTREAAALTRRAERQWLLLCYLLQDTHCGQSNFKRSTHLFIWLDLPPRALCDGIFYWGPLRTKVQGYWRCIIIIVKQLFCNMNMLVIVCCCYVQLHP